MGYEREGMLLLDGRSASEERLQKLKSKIDSLQSTPPGLAAILVGEDPASKIYVRRKMKKCHELGIQSFEYNLNEGVDQKEVESLIEQLNSRPDVHGILLQLPLPKQLSENHLIQKIHPQKDVDGFHPINLGKLVAAEDGFRPCTPLGILRLLEHYQLQLKGKHAVVIGRSRVVGRPLSIMLDLAGATVTVVHLETPDRNVFLKTADIIAVATGKPHLLGGEDIPKDAVVVDVGIHRLDSGKIIGDVNFDEAKEKASAITPVPGGVGPMTICALLENTWKAYQASS